MDSIKKMYFLIGLVGGASFVPLSTFAYSPEDFLRDYRSVRDAAKGVLERGSEAQHRTGRAISGEDTRTNTRTSTTTTRDTRPEDYTNQAIDDNEGRPVGPIWTPPARSPAAGSGAGNISATEREQQDRAQQGRMRNEARANAQRMSTETQEVQGIRGKNIHPTLRQITTEEARTPDSPKGPSTPSRAGPTTTSGPPTTTAQPTSSNRATPTRVRQQPSNRATRVRAVGAVPYTGTSKTESVKRFHRQR